MNRGGEGNKTQLEEARQLASELLEEIELSQATVTQHVRKAIRLARLVGDDQALQWLQYEIRAVPNTEPGRKHMTETFRWTDKDAGKGWWSSVADLEAGVQSLGGTLEASRIESFSGESLIPATRDHRTYQAKIGGQILEYRTVINQVSSMVHDFCLRTYLELEFSARQQSLFESAREEIDGMLAPQVGRSLEKIESVYRRLSEGDPEAISQAMNTVRRLIDSFADAVYPSVADGSANIGDQELKVGQSHVQNRINVFIANHTNSKSRRKRLRQSLSNIYDRASAGSHAEVTPSEARYLFLETYVMLGEILTLSR